MSKRSRLDDVELDARSDVEANTSLRLRCKNIKCRHTVTVTDGPTPNSTAGTEVLFSRFRLQEPDEDELTQLEFQPQPTPSPQGGTVLKALWPMYLVRKDYWICPRCQDHTRIDARKLQRAFPHLEAVFQQEFTHEQWLPDHVWPALKRLRAGYVTDLFAERKSYKKPSACPPPPPPTLP